MTTGTSHFESLTAAENYYNPYFGDPVFQGGNPTASVRLRKNRISPLRRALLRQYVNSKLSAGEIHIGKPTLKAGERLSVHKTERRYFVTDES